MNTAEDTQSGSQDYSNLEFLDELHVDVEDPEDELPVNRPSKRKHQDQDLDKRFNDLLDAVGEVIEASVPQKSRHDAFCRFLTEKMELLPPNMARELEIEFINRVNNLLDELENQQPVNT